MGSFETVHDRHSHIHKNHVALGQILIDSLQTVLHNTICSQTQLEQHSAFVDLIIQPLEPFEYSRRRIGFFSSPPVNGTSTPDRTFEGNTLFIGKVI
jgi:hypothetical protein